MDAVLRYDLAGTIPVVEPASGAPLRTDPGDVPKLNDLPAPQPSAKRQRVAPRGKPWSLHAKAVVGRRAQNGRKGTFPEKY